MQNIDERLNNYQHELLFDIRRSIRYHIYRRRFYDSVNQISTALSLILGSATVSTALTTSYAKIPVLTGALVTIVSAINLVLRSNEKARLHTDLARKFTELEKAIVAKQDINEEDLRKWNAEMLSIEADEPPTKIVLNARCHNDLVRAYNHPDSYRIKIGFLQNLFAQFFDFRPSKLKATNKEIKGEQNKLLAN